MSDSNVLLIVASGKSTRFGGFPKAFCQIGRSTNVENTISLANGIYDKVYLAVNRITFEKYKESVKGCELFSIITGQGDAHSLLKCLNYIKKNADSVNKITVCWGDAVFLNNLPFKQLALGAANIKAAVACSVDQLPYAWFDIDEKGKIVKSYFAKKDGIKNIGMHDQSLFQFDINFAIKYLYEYMHYMRISYENDENDSDKNEMKLLYFFEYLYSIGYGVKCVEITSGNVLSFNTQDELDKIRKRLYMSE